MCGLLCVNYTSIKVRTIGESRENDVYMCGSVKQKSVQWEPHSQGASRPQRGCYSQMSPSRVFAECSAAYV